MSHPEQLTGFDILSKLGEGGMASVWKARQVSLDRIVAIKVLSSKLAGDAEDIARFQTEARAAAKLKHPGIVQVYDANAENGLYYFVMEYVAGYTTGDWVRRKGRIPEREALLVCESVADALGYAWDRERIIHCDIKPDNIMVDEDGSVKVADLGLARTISAMQDADALQDIMGTPAYMSPEQAEGLVDLDCRADIYSLGATLYHLVTGEMLFQGKDAETTIEMQTTETVPDPLDTVPGLSKGLCWLIERMLAKQRDLRQESWEAVKADLARVRKGLTPVGKPLPEGSSTIRRSARRLVSDYNRARRLRETAAATRTPMVKVALVAGIGVAVLIGIWNLVAMSHRRAASPPSVTTTTQPVARAPVESPGDRRAREMFEYAQRWETEHPDDLSTAAVNYRRVVTDAAGTKYSLMAQTAATRLSDRRQEVRRQIIERLKSEVAPMVAQGRIEAAAEHIRGYQGQLADETLSLRRQMADKLLADARAVADDRARRQNEVDAAIEETYDGVVAGVLGGDLPGGVLLVARLIDSQATHPSVPVLREVLAVLQGAMRVDERILQSFDNQRGQMVDVQFASGVKRVAIDSVAGGRVTCKHFISSERYVHSVISFGVADLSARERLLRMGADAEQDVALAKGIMAYESKAFDHARKYFAMTHPALADRLCAGLEQASADRAETDARQALGALLASFGYGVGAYDHDVWLSTVRGRPIDPALKARVDESIVAYVRAHGATRFASEAGDIVAALGAAPAAAPVPAPVEVDGTADATPPATVSRPLLGKDIASARGDVDKALKLLGEMNTRADPESFEIRMEDGVCIGLTIRDGEVETIAPVAAMTGLREFHYEPPNRNERGRLRDLLPLRGMPLSTVRVRDCRVNELRCLQGMPLTSLDVSNTEVRDLSPLRGMMLKALTCADTKVLDLAPLGGMPVEHLNIAGSYVSNMRPVLGMPLRYVDVRGSRVADFSFLQQAPKVEWLDVSDTPIRSLDSIGSRAMSTLLINGTKVRELSAVKGMSLTRFEASGTSIADFAPLRNQPLRHLNLSGTELSDLDFCRGLPLHVLNIDDTSVSSLTPLKGISLSSVNICRTRVSDLEPLRGAPLTSFACVGSKVTDLSPLQGSPIEHLWVDEELVRQGLLRGFPRIETVNGISIIERRAQLDREPGEGRPRRGR